MSVIVCRKEPVRHPYYIENLGIHIYSSQELCYVIYHHPLLTLDGFFNQGLLEFIREELDMGFTALKLERWQKSNENPDEMLPLFLQESNYYSTAEISKFRQRIIQLRKLPPAEYAKKKADYLFQYKQYGKAISGYAAILEEAGKSVDDSFRGSIWHNLGTAYARVFQFSKALDAFDKAYGILKDLMILKKIYELTLLDPALGLKERYQSIVTGDLKAEWDADFAVATEKASESEALQTLEELFQRDSIRRMEGASKMVQDWKQEYRNMT